MFMMKGRFINSREFIGSFSLAMSSEPASVFCPERTERVCFISATLIGAAAGLLIFYSP